MNVRLNELDESALSSLLMTMLPVYLLGTEECGARAAGDEESMEAADRPRPRAAHSLFIYRKLCFNHFYIMKRAECGGACAVAQLWAPS